MTKTVLVVEDENDIRESIINVLTFEHYNTIEASDGRLAVQLAQDHLPDVIICDIHLPELDGYGVIKRLRQQPNTANIPLILLTTLTNEKDIQKGLALGATAYITKPFNANTLFVTIRDSLNQNRAL